MVPGLRDVGFEKFGQKFKLECAEESFHVLEESGGVRVCGFELCEQSVDAGVVVSACHAEELFECFWRGGGAAVRGPWPGRSAVLGPVVRPRSIPGPGNGAGT